MYALYVGGMGARGKNFYNELAQHYGYEKEAKEIQDLYLDGKKKEAEALVPTEWMEQSNLVGPASYVQERIAAFEEAGVTHLSIVPATDNPAGDGQPAQGLGVVRLVERIGRGAASTTSTRSARLDPYDDADRDRIVTLTGRHDFPWDFDQGTAIAFLRDYGVPSIARLLDRTGEFEDHGVKRYDDTLFFQEEAIAEGVDSARSHAAIRPAQPDPRSLRHPQRRVPVRPGHHAGRPGALDQPLRLARPRPGRARRADPVHHPVRRADGDHRAARDLRRLPRAARPPTSAERFALDPANTRVTEATIRIGRATAPWYLRLGFRRVTIALMDEPLRRGARHGGAAALAGRAPSTSACGCARRVLRFAPRRARAPYERHPPDLPERLPARARSAPRTMLDELNQHHRPRSSTVA